MLLCPECLTPIIRSNYESFCPKCGLVIDYTEFMSSYSFSGSVSHNLTYKDIQNQNSDEFAIHLATYYAKVYSKDLPLQAKNRAIALAKRIAKTNLFSHYEAIGFACAQAVKEELGRYVSREDYSFISATMRKEVREILRYMKQKGLYKPPQPREIVENILRDYCLKHGYDFNECLRIYNLIEKNLSGRKYRTAAEIVCHIYSYLHGLQPPIRDKDSARKIKKVSIKLMNSYLPLLKEF